MTNHITSSPSNDWLNFNFLMSTQREPQRNNTALFGSSASAHLLDQQQRPPSLDDGSAGALPLLEKEVGKLRLRNSSQTVTVVNRNENSSVRCKVKVSPIPKTAESFLFQYPNDGDEGIQNGRVVKARGVQIELDQLEFEIPPGGTLDLNVRLVPALALTLPTGRDSPALPGMAAASCGTPTKKKPLSQLAKDGSEVFCTGASLLTEYLC
jgi:hypothetical protein